MRTQYSLAIFALSLVACGDDVRPLGHGQLALTWQVSPRGCADAGVANVSVNLEGPADRNEIFECDKGEVTVRDVVAGTYTVSIEGLDSDGVPRFTSPPTRTTVHPDLTATNAHARLIAKPSEVRVSWRFQDGRVCGAHGVDELNVSAFDKFDYQVATVDGDCDLAKATLTDVLAGTYLIEVSGFGDDGLWAGQGTMSLQRGESAEIEVVLAQE